MSSHLAKQNELKAGAGTGVTSSDEYEAQLREMKALGIKVLADDDPDLLAELDGLVEEDLGLENLTQKDDSQKITKEDRALLAELEELVSDDNEGTDEEVEEQEHDQNPEEAHTPPATKHPQDYPNGSSRLDNSSSRAPNSAAGAAAAARTCKSSKTFTSHRETVESSFRRAVAFKKQGNMLEARKWLARSVKLVPARPQGSQHYASFVTRVLQAAGESSRSATWQRYRAALPSQRHSPRGAPGMEGFPLSEQSLPTTLPASAKAFVPLEQVRALL